VIAFQLVDLIDELYSRFMTEKAKCFNEQDEGQRILAAWAKELALLETTIRKATESGEKV